MMDKYDICILFTVFQSSHFMFMPFILIHPQVFVGATRDSQATPVPSKII